MAPRRGQRPARDLIQAAKFADDTAKGMWRVHKKVCVKCGRATNLPRDTCDEGWKLAKDMTRTGNRLRRLELAASAQGVQGSLW
jgi:hypothetical protein